MFTATDWIRDKNRLMVLTPFPIKWAGKAAKQVYHKLRQKDTGNDAECQGLSLWERWHAAGVTERASPLAAHGQASLRTTSQSASQTAPLVGEPLAKPFTLQGLPKPPLGRGGGSASALTERLSPAAALTQAALPSQSGLRPPRPGCGSQRLLRCRSHPAGRCPNSSSLFPPLAAVVAVAPKGGAIGMSVSFRLDKRSTISRKR